MPPLRFLTLLLPAFAGALFVAIWIFVRASLSDDFRFLLPAPTEVLAAFRDHGDELWRATLNTAAGATLGFLAAVVVSFLLSLLLSLSPLVRVTFYPYLMLLQMTPIIVFAPILVLWVGAGLQSVTIITFLICFFPLAVNTTQGLVSTDRNLVELFQLYRATKFQEIRRLRIPAALPYFFTGLRIAATLAPIGALVGDYTAGSSAAASVSKRSSTAARRNIPRSSPPPRCVARSALSLSPACFRSAGSPSANGMTPTTAPTPEPPVIFPLMKPLLHTLVVLTTALVSVATAQAATPASAAKKPLTKITLQLDWVAEPQHGGIYQAQVRGFFAAEGLDVTIVPGGPNAFVTQKVATNQAQLGQGDSTDILQKIAVGLPLLSVAAVFQDDPSGLLINPSSSVRRFEDLQGKTVIARPEWTFLALLKKKYGVTVNVVPQSFSVAAFLGDKEAIQQGYFIAEPYFIEKAGGAKPRFLSSWDAGFRAYAVLFTNRKFARENPEALRAFMRAYVKGWRDYLEGDPTAAHAAMKLTNSSIDDTFALASRQLILDEKLVTGRDADGGLANIGQLSASRFATQITQLEEIGLLAKGKVTPAQAMTTEFLPSSK